MPSTSPATTPDLSSASDRVLLRRYALHEQHDAFDEIVRRYGKLVANVCLRTTRNPQDAEDAAQATFLALSKCPPTLRKSQCLSSWLYGVAWRTSLRTIRRRQKSRAVELPLDVPGTDESPLTKITTRRDSEVLEEELNRLPIEHRDVLVLNFLLGYSRQEIAEELSATRGVIDGRIKRAKNALRIRLIRRGVTLSAVVGGLNLSSQHVSATGLNGLSSFSAANVTPHIAGLARPEVGFGIANVKTMVAGVLIVASISGLAVAPAATAFANERPLLETRLDEDLDETNAPPAIDVSSAKQTETATGDNKTLGEKKSDSKTDLLSAPGEWGSIRGSIKVTGKIPKPILMFPKGTDIKDTAVCAAKNVFDRSLLVDTKSAGLANCFVYIFSKLRQRYIRCLNNSPRSKLWCRIRSTASSFPDVSSFKRTRRSKSFRLIELPTMCIRIL